MEPKYQNPAGVWPKYPLVIPTDDGFEATESIRAGMTLRYPAPGGEIRRGVVASDPLPVPSWKVGIVYFTNGDWCYDTEVSYDKD